MKNLLLGILLLIASVSAAQVVTPLEKLTDSTRVNDPIYVEPDEQVRVEEIETYADKWVPRKASLYSAVLPGLGQIYNQKYWKLPIVYGGLAFLGFTAKFYDDRHDLYRAELFQLLQDETYVPPSGANEEQLRSIVNKARRERDFYMILTGVFYFMQILDAHIDAHLKEFDLNPELKVTVDPMIRQNMYARKTFDAGLSLKLTFK